MTGHDWTVSHIVTETKRDHSSLLFVERRMGQCSPIATCVATFFVKTYQQLPMISLYFYLTMLTFWRRLCLSPLASEFPSVDRDW